MALTRTRPTKLRLTFNFRTGVKSTDKIRGFAQALVQEVAIDAADEMWKEIRGKIEKRIEVDVFREISKMAQLYKQLVIGISGSRDSLHGTLTPASQFASGMAAQSKYLLRTPLQPRQSSYLKWKKRRVGHQRWFEHTGLLSRNMGRGKFWTDTFGPVQVDVIRNVSMSHADARRTINSQPTKELQSQYSRRFNTGAPSVSGYSMKLNVATIRVAALDTITPQMLPALLSGNINDVAPDGRATGLIRKFPKNVAMHLAGSSQKDNFVPYRHTIEPFLGFYLTRAIPNAVLRRIQDGLGTDIRYYSDKGGRDEKFAGRI